MRNIEPLNTFRAEPKFDAGIDPYFPKEKPLLALLKTTPFFYELTSEEFAEISREIRVHRLSDETVIIQEGERGESLYFTISGVMRVTIRNPGSDKNILLSKLQDSDFFGEYSIITNRPRTATVCRHHRH